MDSSIQNSERLTAILSTLVALAILSVGVTAQQTRSARPDELSFLESDLRFQLEAAYRMNPQEGAARHQQLESVLSSWRESPRTEADRRRLATWLLEATIRSMPGSLEELPAAPQFGAAEPTAEAAPIAEATPIAEESDGSGKNFDIMAEPATPFVPGLTPDLAPAAETAVSVAPGPASTPAEHTLVSIATPAAKPAFKPSPEPATAHVEINLGELSARIAGYHQGVSELESTLLTGEPAQIDWLREQIHVLEGLAKDYQFVQLYYDALSANERQSVESPRSLEPLVETLDRHLDRLQSDADTDFLGEFDAALGKKVAQLRRQLDEIASRGQ